MTEPNRLMGRFLIDVVLLDTDCAAATEEVYAVFMAVSRLTEFAVGAIFSRKDLG
jgi:hypothetical protein